MNFTSFKTIVKNEVENRVDRTCIVRFHDVVKNNGIVLTGLTVVRDDINISPTIYLNAYYEAYKSGQSTLGEVIDDVLKVYEKNKVNKSIDMRYFLNYKEVRHRIVYNLINTEKNRKLLQDIPHIEFHDLSIVFQFLITDGSLGNTTILIHNAHLKVWNISLDELYEDACHNTPILNKYEIKNMRDAISELMSSEIEQETEPLYVLSNKNKIRGAACMLYPDLLKTFSDAIDSNLFIIPSSVHEVLLLPANNSEESDSIKRLIKEVNDTQVDAEEILSYSVYFYSRADDEICML